MTRRDTATILASVRIAWPHSNLGGDPNEVLTFWSSMLGEVSMTEAEAAVRELAATGREHAPPVGVLIDAVARRSTDLPDFDEAWRETQTLIRRRGLNQKPTADDFSHPTIAAFALPAWAELCTSPAEGTNGYGTHYAQQREAYRALRGRSQRSEALGLVGAPRHRGELKLLDPLSAAGIEKP